MSATAAARPIVATLPLSTVAERRAVRPCQPGADRPSPRSAPAAWRRARRPAAATAAAGVRTRDHVADREDLGVAGQRRSAATVTRPARSMLAPVASPSAAASRRRARRPPRRRCAPGCAARAVLALDLHAVRRRRRRPMRAEHRRDAERAQRARGLRRELRRERGRAPGRQPRRAGCGASRVDGAEVAPSVSRAISAIWPASSTPVGPGADDHEGEPRARGARDRSRSRRPRRRRGCAARISIASSSVLSPGAARAPLVVAEVGVARAGRDDERVVVEHALGAAAGHRREQHLAPLEVEAATSPSSDLHVALALEHAAQRRGDLARRQRARRHLVEQRLEEVEVAPVDERDVDRRAPQRARGLSPPKPPPTTTTRWVAAAIAATLSEGGAGVKPDSSAPRGLGCRDGERPDGGSGSREAARGRGGRSAVLRRRRPRRAPRERARTRARSRSSSPTSAATRSSGSATPAAARPRARRATKPPSGCRLIGSSPRARARHADGRASNTARTGRACSRR